MRNDPTLAVTIVMLAALAPDAFAGDCVVSDDFSDGTPAGTWSHARSNASVQDIVERNGRVEFPSATGNPGIEALALGLSAGWFVDMTVDWGISGRWHITPPFPNFGDVGMSFVLVLEGDLNTLYLRDGFTLNAGIQNVGQGVYVYESTRIYDDGTFSTATTGNRAFTENVVYLWYEAATGCVYYNDHPGQQGAVQICGIGGLSSVTQAYVGFLAFNFGSVPSFGGSSLWCDDICVRYGRVVGASVGACCIGESCVETIATSCSGVWQGDGSDCDACTAGCEADIDGDGDVGFFEVLLILATWGCTGDPCAGEDPPPFEDLDVDGNGRIGFGDVLAVLAAWGPC